MKVRSAGSTFKGSLVAWLRKLLPAASCAWLCSALGCSVPTRRQTFVEPVSSRPYTVVSREDHDAGHPARVLFSLHAYGNEPDVLVGGFGLVQRAVEQRGWLLVIPQGERDANGARCWNASAACCGVGEREDDVRYLRAVLADVRRRFAVDDASVSAIGVSNGGFMAQRWACEPGGDLRLIVSVAGAAPGPDDAACRPTVPVSVLHIHGDADDVIRYAGGISDPLVVGQRGRYPSAQQTAASWLRVGPTAVASAGLRPQVSSERTLFFSVLRRERYELPGRSVQLWTVEGGNHRLRVLRTMLGQIFAFIEDSLPR